MEAITGLAGLPHLKVIHSSFIIIISQAMREKKYCEAHATSENSDQRANPCNLTKVFPIHRVYSFSYFKYGIYKPREVNKIR